MTKKITKAHDLKIGDIFNTNWGYDQSNIEFYQVTEIIGKKTVKIRKLLAEAIRNERTYAYIIPRKNSFDPDEKEMLKRVQEDHKGEPCVKISIVAYGRMWDGEPKIYNWA